MEIITCQEEQLVNQITELYEKISSLESLKPSKDANMLFTQLVLACTPPSPIEVPKLSSHVQEMRSKLIKLCGEAEGLMEKHYSTLLGAYENPLDHLDVFPYFSNYLKLGLLEYNIMSRHSTKVPKRIAFVGSGPLPLTSLVLARYHLTTTQFDNYDIDSSANQMASRLVAQDPDLSKRMQFHTKDVMNLGKNELEKYDVVFLAALVGMDKKQKVEIIHHLAKNMAPGSTLMVRSAHGARAFLYPVVDSDDLHGFEVLSIFHPTDEVINSVVIARKPFTSTTKIMTCQEEQLVNQITELYEKISSLESLKPSTDANMLFTQLVLACTPPSPIEVPKLSSNVQEMRSKLIKLCGEAEGLMEKHYSTLIGAYENPLEHLDVFPYISNYLKLGLLEYNILNQHTTHIPKRIAFVGSGPLPLTSFVLARYHLTTTQFDNYDIDLSANQMASRLVAQDPDLSKRMQFHTKDVMNLKDELEKYDVVFLAALVGMDKKQKVEIIHHLAKNMSPGSTLMVRSAHGARAFLYPVVDADDLRGFEVLSIFHPTDEVINSVVIARKPFTSTAEIMTCQEEQLVNQITELYEKISSLESLKPSKDANMLFTQLVLACTPPSPIEVPKLSSNVQEMRSKLIKLCGEAEGLMEKHYSSLIGAYENPLDHLDVFPYFSNYLKLGLLEYNILNQHTTHVPKRIAFVGSGPLPLTSFVLARYHLTTTQFDNYDIDSSANHMASRLVAQDPDLSKRMQFHTKDVMNLKDELEKYDVVFLAALVGIDKTQKVEIIHHLAKNMAPGSTLMVRSAHGARAFLYPVVDADDLHGFEVLSIFHPTDEVINSVVIARKPLA